MPDRSRPSPDREQRRGRILRAAIRLFAERGIAGTTYGHIAASARLSRPLVYFYFPEMAALVEAAAEESLGMLRERFEAASSGPGDGAARILAIAGAYLGFHQEEPERFALLAQCEAFRPDGPSQDPDTAPSALQEHHDAIMGVMVEALRAGKKDGSLQQDLGDPLATAYCLWGMVHGLIQLQATKSATLDRDLGRRGSRLAWEGVHLIRLAIETRRPRRMRLT